MDELHTIKRVGLDTTKFGEYQVLCMPENVLSASSTSELFNAGETINLCKLLKAKNIKAASAYDLGVDVGVLERRAKDKWLGLIWIRDKAIVPIVISVISGFIVSSIVQKKQGDKHSQPNIVHVSFCFEEGQNVSKFTYDGDTETLLTLLKGIEPNETTVPPN